MSTAKQLIEQRLTKMGEYEGMDEYRYVCSDTGMSFCTYGQKADCSPFTGTSDIMPVDEDEDVVDDEIDPVDFEDVVDDEIDPVDFEDDLEDDFSAPYEYYGESAKSARSRK